MLTIVRHLLFKSGTSETDAIRIGIAKNMVIGEFCVRV